MNQLVVNNPNILLDAPRAKRRGAASSVGSGISEKLLERLAKFRRRVSGVACSSAWMEDCLYRGREYAPDFRCACGRCRRKFATRRHPRDYRQSLISTDCQVEGEEDPEMAEELAKLRNERPRVGSVLVRDTRGDRGSGAARRGKTELAE